MHINISCILGVRVKLLPSVVHTNVTAEWFLINLPLTMLKEIIKLQKI